MTLLKKQVKTKGRKFIAFLGVKIPVEVGDFLTLYSLATNCSKSSIVQELLNDWKIAKQREIAIEEIYSMIVQRSLESFRRRKVRSLTFLGFCNLLRYEFQGKGISLPPELAEKLIKMIKDEKNSEDKRY